jgi:hypothetical protein
VPEFVSSLPWPLIAVGAMIFFGRDVRRWLKERPAKVKFGSTEAEWVRQAATTEAHLESADAPISGRGRNRSVVADTLMPEAGEERMVSVRNAASAVEDALRGSWAGAQEFGHLGLGVSRAWESAKCNSTSGQLMRWTV